MKKVRGTCQSVPDTARRVAGTPQNSPFWRNSPSNGARFCLRLSCLTCARQCQALHGACQAPMKVNGRRGSPAPHASASPQACDLQALHTRSAQDQVRQIPVGSARTSHRGRSGIRDPHPSPPISPAASQNRVVGRNRAPVPFALVIRRSGTSATQAARGESAS